MEPNLNISIKPRNQTGPLITLRDERARAVARSARLGKALTLAAMSLGYVVVQLDVTIVNVAINSIGADFGGSVADLQWIVNAYTITFAAFILTAGALGDRLGARRVFIAGFAIFVLASLACALAPALPVLIIARLCQGIGAAILVPNSLALLNHAYPKERRAPLGGRYLGGRREFLADRGTIGRRLADRTLRLAQYLLDQSADRPCRHLADLALRDRDRALGGAHARHTGPDHGGAGAGIARRGDDRRRRTRLERFVRAHGLCRLCGAGITLSCHRIQIASPDAAARLVPQARVQRNVPDRSFGQYRLLRLDLRLQPLFSAAQSPLATMDRACLRADDGGSAGDQFDRGASDCGNRRTADDRYRPCDHRHKLPRTAGSAGRCTLSQHYARNSSAWAAD